MAKLLHKKDLGSFFSFSPSLSYSFPYPSKVAVLVDFPLDLFYQSLDWGILVGKRIGQGFDCCPTSKS